MKTRKTLIQTVKLTGIMAAVVFLASCSDFLTENPQSSTGVSTFYKTKADFQQAVNAVYGVAHNLYNGNQAYILNDLRSDNIVGDAAPGGNSQHGQGAIDQFLMNSSNEVLQPLWQTQYNGIARANRVITYLEDQDFEGKAELRGQAKALRALFYFNLVREFGKVQLVTTPTTEINTARVSVDSVYSQIISDLQDAESSLPATFTGSDDGRIAKGAAQSLLGTVYLARKSFSDAAAEFKKVVDSGNYSLADDYGDLWKEDTQGQKNESVWRIVYRADEKGDGSKFPNWFAPNLDNSKQDLLGNGHGNAFGFFIPTKDIAEAYTNNDARKNCIATYVDATKSQPEPARYVKCYVQQTPVSGGNSSTADWYIIRYANVLLRYAEALQQSGQGSPLKYVNMVRERAGLADYSGGNLLQEIYNQERLESPFEGHRWNNLVRRGQAVSVMNSKLAADSTSVGPTQPIDDHQTIYPVPDYVTGPPSNASQNDGY